MKIVFFDGYCGLCNKVVNLLMRWDNHRQLRFASLQGSTAKKYLGSLVEEQMFGSFIYFENGHIYQKSEAIIHLLSSLGGPWRFLSQVLYLIPRFFREICYQIIAKHRYYFFGKMDVCRVPNDEEAQRLLP